MPDTKPLVLLPGEKLTLADIHRLLPTKTRLDGDALIARNKLTIRLAAKSPTNPKR